MCKVIYRADDGKEFDNKEDCARYSALPHVWVVTRHVAHGPSTYSSVMGIFTHKEDAAKYAKRNNKNLGVSYQVNREVINKLM